MQFIIIAYDGTDEGALQRRMEVRDAHLQAAQKMYENGKLLYAAGIFDDNGRMAGSMMICDFPSRQKLDLWLKTEPYVTGNVWKDIKINRAQVAPFCANK